LSLGHRILLVEDDVSVRGVLRKQLELEGYVVAEASNGRQALELALSENPDLILLDLMMPEMDGLEFMRRLKSHRDAAGIPIIVLTAKDAPGDKATGLQDGANDYLTKPYEKKELLLRIRNLLEWSRLQREANPLTGLPGNVSIEHEVRSRIMHKERFAFLYLDIDHFKAFNDRYGYQRGDEAIKMLATIIAEKAERLGDKSDFVGHVGGDDFVVVCAVEKAVKISQAIIKAFDERIQNLFDEDDLERGCLKVVSRRGVPEQFPFMTLTIAMVMCDGDDIKHFARISDIVSELKQYGKTFQRSILVQERRTEEVGNEQEESTAFPGSYS
jgi:diguanylate cyclase (GGDEF)-like protein